MFELDGASWGVSGASLDEGVAWLCREVSAFRDLPLEELCDRLLRVLPDALDDDVALLALRAHPPT